MNRKSITALLACVMLLVEPLSMSQILHPYSGELTVDESLPVLRSISKIYPVRVVKSSPFAVFRTLPHFCWTTPESAKGGPDMRSIAAALTKRESLVQWLFVNDTPCICMIGQPRDSSYAISLSKAAEFREKAVEDIPSVGAFIELSLDLVEKPSLGLDLTNRDLTLDGVSDFYEPTVINVYLVADPKQFASRPGIVTSDYDRSLHFGLSEDEILHLESLVEKHPRKAYGILSRFRRSYEKQMVLPEEIPDLEKDCLELAGDTSDPIVARALEKLLSICTSASRYRLGILLQSL